MEEKEHDANLENLIREVSEVKNRLNILEQEVTNMKIDSAKTQEQYKNMFTILNDIKDSIKIIASKLDTLEKKPAQHWEDTVKTVITVVVSCVVTAIVTILI